MRTSTSSMPNSRAFSAEERATVSMMFSRSWEITSTKLTVASSRRSSEKTMSSRRARARASVLTVLKKSNGSVIRQRVT